nr:type VI secretion system-associated FHA domain protein TagH [Pseudomonadota bacterium]
AMQAVLQGAGLGGLTIDSRDAPQALQRLGALLRVTVRGVLDLLQARNEVRTGFNIPSHTQVGAINNNPFKSLTVARAGPRSREEQVLGLLLGGPDPAYLPPVQALQQAFDDVKAHELAVMAGMEAALAQLLERFRPDNLKARIDQGSVLDNVLPGGRRARYWEEFQRLYEEIVQEARDDSQKLFEGEFERAYEALVRKLAQRPESGP